MPRGGGFGGGGFRGGGFRGGGGSFRGSSFRSSSFRSSGFRSSSSSRPFGRTGASRTRINTRSPYTRRSHHSYYHRPYYRRYHHYHRPYYYRRWYYRPWWAGHYYNPWYRTPGIICGGFVVFIMFFLILLPLVGIAFSFPLAGSSNSGAINYRSTETIYFNEYWYEYESMNAGGQISFDIQSSTGDVNFAIADHTFDGFGRKSVSGSDSLTFTLQGASEDYQYYQIFLKAGSTITYEYNASANVNFFIANGEMVYNWDLGDDPVFYREETTDFLSSTYSVLEEQDYYLVWYNPTGADINVNYLIEYAAVNIVDFSDSVYYALGVATESGTVLVENTGTYYFFVYLDPFYSAEEATTITFDVTFSTNISNTNRWINFRPWLIIFGLLGIFLIISAVRGRRKQKELNNKNAKNSTSQSAQKMAQRTQKAIYGQSKSPTIKPQSPSSVTKDEGGGSAKKCIFCNTPLSKNAIFCTNCGRKQEGRSIGTVPLTTPYKSKICSFCGRKLPENVSFCPDCGVKVEDQ